MNVNARPPPLHQLRSRRKTWNTNQGIHTLPSHPHFIYELSQILQSCFIAASYTVLLSEAFQLCHQLIIPYVNQWDCLLICSMLWCTWAFLLCIAMYHVPGHPHQATSSYINPGDCPCPPPPCWPDFHNWDHRGWQLYGHLIINFTCLPILPGAHFHWFYNVVHLSTMFCLFCHFDVLLL